MDQAQPGYPAGLILGVEASPQNDEAINLEIREKKKKGKKAKGGRTSHVMIFLHIQFFPVFNRRWRKKRSE
jgi:hypothetical protein